jgi:hypothetical protein
MKTKFLALIMVFGGIASADFNDSVPYTKITEKEAKLFVTVGMDEKEVVKKVGPPNFTNVDVNGTEAITYLTGPPQTTTLSYTGFEVFLKDKKVTSVEIIHGKID